MQYFFYQPKFMFSRTNARDQVLRLSGRIFHPDLPSLQGPAQAAGGSGDGSDGTRNCPRSYAATMQHSRPWGCTLDHFPRPHEDRRHLNPEWQDRLQQASPRSARSLWCHTMGLLSIQAPDKRQGGTLGILYPRFILHGTGVC